MAFDPIEIPRVTDAAFGEWSLYQLFNPMMERNLSCHYICTKCEHRNTTVIPKYANTFKYETCTKCGQMFFMGLMKNGYGPDSFDDFLIVTKVYKRLYETLQNENGYLNPKDHPNYDLLHSYDPQTNYESFCKQIALARNYQILSKFVDYGTPIGL